MYTIEYLSSLVSIQNPHVKNVHEITNNQCYSCFLVDEDESMNEKKSNRNKKLATQPSNIARTDSQMDSSFVGSSSTSTVNLEAQDSMKSNTIDQFAPYIPVNVSHVLRSYFQ
jgi:hypothetical protein